MEEYFIPEMVQRRIVHTTSPAAGAPDVLMEDTNYTMEDLRALMGGPTTPEALIPIV